MGNSPLLASKSGVADVPEKQSVAERAPRNLARPGAQRGKQALRSTVHDALQAYDRLSQHLISLANALRQSTSVNACAHTEPDAAGEAVTFLTGLSGAFLVRCRRSVEPASLEATMMSHLPSGLYRRARRKPQRFASHRFRYAKSTVDVAGWIEESSARFFSTAELASRLLELYVDRWLRDTLPECANPAGNQTQLAQDNGIMEKCAAGPVQAASRTDRSEK